MIKAEDLMINNWVSYEGKPYQIFSTGGDFPTLNTIEFGAGVVSYENLAPIPLSEKWLLDFGFVESNILDKYFTFNNQFAISTADDKFRFICGNFVCQIVICELTHVHELQNLMSALKQPLTFKPTEL